MVIHLGVTAIGGVTPAPHHRRRWPPFPFPSATATLPRIPVHAVYEILCVPGGGLSLKRAAAAAAGMAVVAGTASAVPGVRGGGPPSVPPGK